MQKLISFIFLVFITISSIHCSSPAKLAKETTSQEVSIKDQIAKGAFIVDVRTPGEFSEGSVQGAVNIPLDEVESRINEFKGKPFVIVFCRSGNRSGKAKNILENHGIQHVSNGINTESMKEEMAK
jgi:rhodanese-related sulfurtransferase